MNSKTTATAQPKVTGEPEYVTAFHRWMKDWNPDAFVTINLPHERYRPRDPLFYLNYWTRSAEADVLGPRTLKLPDYDRRIVWMFRREVAPDELIHYHGIVRFPPNREWRHERTAGVQDLAVRCKRLQDALKAASAITPEPFTKPSSAVLRSQLDRLKKVIALRPRLVKKNQPPQQRQPVTSPSTPPTQTADIDVRPFDAVHHAPYLLKGLWRFVPEAVTDETTWDSGLIILPHLPKKGTTEWQQNEQRETASSASA